MRVLAIVHNYPPRHNAGAEWMLHPMLAALAKRGHQVEVYLSRHIPGDNGRLPWKMDDVYVYPLGAKGRSELRPDVYVTHLDCIRPVAASGRGYGVPVVVVQHNTLDFDLGNIREGRPSLIVHNSDWMRQWMQDNGYVFPGIVVRPPVHEDLYKTTPGDRVTLINMTGGKGAPLFWQLAERMPDTKFLAVQGNYGGQIIQEGHPNVEVVGPFDGRVMRDEVYSKTKILMMPSYYESWGRVVTEAMCSGIPVIAHRAIGALHENLGDAAIWADRDEPDAWVAEIKRLSKPAEYAKASEACRAQFETFDPEGELALWCNTLEDLARVPRTRPSEVITTRSAQQAPAEPVAPQPEPEAPEPAQEPRATGRPARKPAAAKTTTARSKAAE